MNTPTLCLVMDGDKIVSADMLTLDESTLALNKAAVAPFTLRTIPLSQCALVPEMVGLLQSAAGFASLCPEIPFCGSGVYNSIRAFLASLQPSAESQS